MISNHALARPYHGDVFTYYQPDGEEIEIRLYGDEFYAVAETLDGYTLTRDLATGFFSYAVPGPDSMSFTSTGIKAGDPIPPSLDLKKNTRLSRQALQKHSEASRAKFGVDSKGKLLPSLRLKLRPQDFGYERWTPDLETEAKNIQALDVEALNRGVAPESIYPGPPGSTTTGTRVGLVLLARFPDRLSDATISEAEVDAYVNDPNYNNFGNATSVYGYFSIQSDGKLQYNCIVTGYFTAAHNRDYYTDNTISYGTRAKELINEGLTVLKSEGFDFTKVDGNSDSVIDGVNIFYAGSRVNSWSEGLWPHKWSSSWAGLSGQGVSTSFQYQITNMGSQLTLGTFCHENGHMIGGFPDLYSYNGNAANIGSYSLMHLSGSTHPVHVDAYLKMHAGWTNIIDITSASHLRGAVQVDTNAFYRFRNPSESREYFLLSMRTNSGYEGLYNGATANNPTDGLVIWHAREHGSNTYSSIFTADSPNADYSTPYELMVVEANPSSATTPWYNDPAPGSIDGYHSGDIDAASDSTSPALKFWNTSTGRTTNSNLNIHSIGAQGDAMTFTIGAGAVAGSPAIGTTRSTLTPSTNYGTDAASQSFAVFNQGGGTLSYTLSESISWLSLDVASGTATSEADVVTISYDTDSLDGDSYVGTIVIADSDAANSPKTVTVNLTVHNQPTISLDSTTLSKTLAGGTTGKASLFISNSGGGTLSYTLESSASWLGLSSGSGTAAVEEDEIEVTFDASALLGGTYNGTITVSSINATNSPQIINVTMTVTGEVLVMKPGGGETLWRGNTQRIQWLTSSAITDNVRIELYKGGALDSTIISSTANDGQYNWNIPGGQTIRKDYKVRISSVDNTGIYGESGRVFSVAALPTLTSIPYTEGFEASMGSWTQASDEDFDWTRDSGGTPSSATGPGSAQAGTFYAYTESSSPNFPSKTARLEAHFDLRSATAPIMSFYYHMYGATMGTLTIRASADQKNWTTLFNQTGNQGNAWQAAFADLSAFAGQAVKIQIIGTTGSSYTSDMALDSVIISESTKSLSYSSDTFSEAIVNDGSISNSITITATGDTFTSTAVSGGYVTTTSVPSGLTASFVRNSSTQITMTLMGNATSHANTNTIFDLGVTFSSGAFTGGNASSVAGNVKYLAVDFIDNTIAPDLIVQSPNVSDSSLTPGQTFYFSATVRNQGNVTSSSTTLKYYRSTDSTVSSGDTQIGKDAVEGLPAGDISPESISLTAPSTDGTYYVGACVDAVAGESSTTNNCSTGVQITVGKPSGLIAPLLIAPIYLLLGEDN